MARSGGRRSNIPTRMQVGGVRNESLMRRDFVLISQSHSRTRKAIKKKLAKECSRAPSRVTKWPSWISLSKQWDAWKRRTWRKWKCVYYDTKVPEMGCPFQRCWCVAQVRPTSTTAPHHRRWDTKKTSSKAIMSSRQDEEDNTLSSSLKLFDARNGAPTSSLILGQDNPRAGELRGDDQVSSVNYSVIPNRHLVDVAHNPKSYYELLLTSISGVRRVLAV